MDGLTRSQEHESSILEGLHGLQRKKPRMRLHLTAMIDVIFLLLTFFVLTAKFRIPEQFLPVSLPDSEAAQSVVNVIDPWTLAVAQSPGNTGFTVDLNGILYAVNRPSLEEDMTLLANGFVSQLDAAHRRPKDPIILQCDEQLQWDYLVKLYNLLYSLGATEIQFDL